MVTLEARMVKVPFKGVTPKTPPVPVWLIPDRRVLSCGSTAHTLVPLRTFVRNVLPQIGPAGEAKANALFNRRRRNSQELPFQLEGNSEVLVTWRDLSELGWAQEYIKPPADTDVELPHYGNRYSYWTVFFAQNVMRGFLTRLMELEMQASERDAEGEVYWAPMVEAMRNEIRAYDNIPPVRAISSFADKEIAAMWGRVLGRVSASNRKNLEQCLAMRKGQVLKMQHEEG